MEADLVQAILDMDYEQPLDSRDLVAPAGTFGHINENFEADKGMASLRWAPRTAFEKDLPPASAFLDKHEPVTRDDIERVVAAQTTLKADLNHARPDDAYGEWVPRVNPQQAHVDQRKLPLHVYDPTTQQREFEYNRIPNPTGLPLQPFDPDRPQAKEEHTVPERAVGRLADGGGVFGGPVAFHAVDESRYYKDIIMNIPERYLEETAQAARPDTNLGLKTHDRAEFASAGPGVGRLREDQQIFMNLENRAPVFSRDFGDGMVPAQIIRERFNKLLPIPIPGPTKLSGETPHVAREGLGDMLPARPLAQTALELREGDKPHAEMGHWIYDHLGTESIEMLHALLRNPATMAMEQSDHLSYDLHLAARAQAPYAIM